MSSFICDREHISALAYAISDHVKKYEPAYPADSYVKHVSSIAQTLADQNGRSYGIRYSEPFVAEPFKLDTSWDGIRAEPIDLIKSARCYQYQLAEHDKYQETEAYQLTERLIAFMTSRLSGYDAANWGAPKRQAGRSLMSIARGAR